MSERIAGKCKVCGGALAARNISGLCRRTFACRSEGQRLKRLATVQSRKIKGKGRDNWLVPDAFDLDTGELIIDEVAVEVAVAGTRQVALSPAERREVVRLMLATGVHSIGIIAAQVGTTSLNIRPILETLGYEEINDQLYTAGKSSRKVIVGKDRRTGPSILNELEDIQPMSDLPTNEWTDNSLHGSKRRAPLVIRDEPTQETELVLK